MFTDLFPALAKCPGSALRAERSTVSWWAVHTAWSKSKELRAGTRPTWVGPSHPHGSPWGGAGWSISSDWKDWQNTESCVTFRDDKREAQRG